MSCRDLRGRGQQFRVSELVFLKEAFSLGTEEALKMGFTMKDEVEIGTGIAPEIQKDLDLMQLNLNALDEQVRALLEELLGMAPVVVPEETGAGSVGFLYAVQTRLRVLNFQAESISQNLQLLRKGIGL